MTLEDLVNAGFIEENWPDVIPMPGEANIQEEDLGNKIHRYTYEAQHDGKTFAACVEVNRGQIEDPAEGVVFMLNQFAYLFRSKPDRVERPDGAETYQTKFG